MEDVPEITASYTLSLRDALPISRVVQRDGNRVAVLFRVRDTGIGISEDRKSTRLNSSHRTISYAVFCLKKKIHLPHQQCSGSRPVSDRELPPPHRGPLGLCRGTR